MDAESRKRLATQILQDPHTDYSIEVITLARRVQAGIATEELLVASTCAPIIDRCYGGHEDQEGVEPLRFTRGIAQPGARGATERRRVERRSSR